MLRALLLTMLRIVVCIALLVCCAHAQNLSLTLLTNPDPEGAVCLDGMTPARQPFSMYIASR